jgi:hypothetical protein
MDPTMFAGLALAGLAAYGVPSFGSAPSGKTRFILVPAPGHYGDKARVFSSHRTLAAARKAAKRLGSGVVVREGSKKRGDQWLRVYEGMYPRR